MSLPDIGSSLPEIILRTAIVYLFLVIVLRLSGKREVGQLSILELIVILVDLRRGPELDGRREHDAVGRSRRRD